MSSSSCDTSTKSIGEKLYNYLEENPTEYDVTFLVGPERKIVRGLKAVLKASSAVFKSEFNYSWQNSGAEDQKPIHLPDLDAHAFQLLVKLILLDKWTLNSLKKMNLPGNDLLNLIKICRSFGMKSVIQNVEEMGNKFIRSLFKSPMSGYLHLSRENLEVIVESDELEVKELDLFIFVNSWAVARCTELDLKPIAENIRQVLGGCLYEIRFPLMSLTDFTEARQLHDRDILTPEEIILIYNYIGLTDSKKSAFDKSLLPFKTDPRKAPFADCISVSLTKTFKIVDNPSFECNGDETHIRIASNKKIALHGLGFLGPIKADSFYDVSMRIYDYLQDKDISEKMTTRIFATKGKIFHWIFEHPIILNERKLIDKKGYAICFELKGSPTSLIERPDDTSLSLIKESGVDILFTWESDQLAGILFKKLPMIKRKKYTFRGHSKNTKKRRKN